jgi:DNA-binding NarL/FixJ family response regulator
VAQQLVWPITDTWAAILIALASTLSIALMDVRMPGMDEHVYDALKAGASGFLLKDTGRERLIGGGLSNQEIGEELFISLATVKTHVRHVPAKLDLRDRVQAVVFAYESGLVRPGA